MHLLNVFVLLTTFLVIAFSPRGFAAVTFQKAYTDGDENVGLAFDATIDGGWILAGYSCCSGYGEHDILLVKIDATGKIQWSRIYGGNRNDEPRAIRQTSDGGYVIAGWTDSFGAGKPDVYFLKTDNQGNLLWSKTYGGTERDIGQSVDETNDGGYIIAGTTSSIGAGSSDVYLIKVDSLGDPQWARAFGGEQTDSGFAVVQTSDSGYVAVGSRDTDVYLFKTTAAGALVWSRAYGGPEFEWGSSVQETSDGSLIVAGSTDSFGFSRDIYLIKVNGVGDLAWSKVVGGIGSDDGKSIRVLDDGGFIIAGDTFSFNTLMEMYLIKTDSEGKVQWSNVFNPENFSNSTSEIRLRSDGSVALFGWTKMFPNEVKYHLVLTNDTGNTVCQQRAVTSVETTVQTVSQSPMTSVSADVIEGTPSTLEGPRTSWESELCFAALCINPPPSLVAWYPLDDPSNGLLVRDLVGTNDGASRPSPLGAGGPTPSTGLVGGALSFDGIDDYVEVPDSASLNFGAGDLSIDLWVETGPIAPGLGVSRQALLSKFHNTGGGYTLELVDGSLVFSFAGNPPGSPFGIGTTFFASASQVFDGHWHHVAVTLDRDQGRPKFYVDGTHIPSSGPTAVLESLDNPANISIGRNSPDLGQGADFFKGSLDEIELFDRVLDPEEVKAIYEAGSAGKCKDDICPPWDVEVCRDELTTEATVTVCNHNTVPQFYDLSYSPLDAGFVGAGGGCHVDGPTSFTDQTPSNPVEVAAQSCEPVKITIGRPSGLTNAQTACYEATLTNLATQATVSRAGSVQASDDWCAKVQADPASPYVVGTARPVTFQVTNTGFVDDLFDYEIEEMRPDGISEDPLISLDGLAPGMSTTGSIFVPAGETRTVSVSVAAQRDERFVPSDIILNTDLDGDGTTDPLVSVAVRTAPAGVVACDPATPGALIGTPGDDRIVGTRGDDVIIGLGGDDILIGGSGADCIAGDAGNDVIVGGSGDDYIDGGLGDDRLRGGSGADIIIGAQGADTVIGGSGDDVLETGPGDDLVIGGSGNDVVDAGLGNDTVSGGSGTDMCFDAETLRGCEL